MWRKFITGKFTGNHSSWKSGETFNNWLIQGRGDMKEVNKYPNASRDANRRFIGFRSYGSFHKWWYPIAGWFRMKKD